MKLIFLGTGTSSGVPAIGCHCPVCTSTDPRDTRLRTSAAVQWTDPRGIERTILIDAGPDLRQQCLKNGIERLDAILFTHNHVDHTFGLDEVRRFNAIQKSPIDIYADERTHVFLRRVYQHIFDADQNVNQSFVATLIPHRITPLQSFELYGVKITPIPLLHGRLPVLGFRFDCGAVKSDLLPLAYCTDLSVVPNESWPVLADLRTLILDGLRHRHHPTHLTIGQATDLALNLKPQQTWLIHMSHDVGHQELDDSLPEGISPAHDGQILTG
ncbi:MAG: MBL fold metallo-hydrolase [Planctomycetes bacterium]|nr:MBL fold metallo-hydrolase [Planctomycetota bacterium]